MRRKLIPYLHQLVLVKGWVDCWEDFDFTKSRRVCVKQPTIKVADKNSLFANQKMVSTEHHINLFIPHEYLGDYEAHFITHAPISFSGVVVEYSRRNGTIDYGISASPQHRFLIDLERLCLAVADISRRMPLAPSTLAFYEQAALPQVLALQERLKAAGNSLLTFDKTQNEYEVILEKVLYIITRARNGILFQTSNRQNRRRIGRKFFN